MLRVYPNPYDFIHPELGPQGACPEDNAGRNNAPRRWVGAKLKSETLEKRDKPEITVDKLVFTSETRPDRERNWFTFDMSKPASLPETPYYKDRLREGGLIAADAETARKSRAMYTSVDQAREAGVKRWDAERQNHQPSGDEMVKRLQALVAPRPAEESNQAGSGGARGGRKPVSNKAGNE